MKNAEEEETRLLKETRSGVRPNPLLSEISEGRKPEKRDHEISDSEMEEDSETDTYGGQ